MIEARIALSGEIAGAEFPVWIARHAAKLGVAILDRRDLPHAMEITVAGPAEMLHALALAATLGPQSVQVEQVRLTRGAVILAAY